MSHEVRLFQTVARIINKFLPGMLEANRISLAYLITGIIGSRHVQLSQVASKVVYAGKETSLSGSNFRGVRHAYVPNVAARGRAGSSNLDLLSLVERFRRFLQNENIVVRTEFMPFLGLILAGLSQERLVLLIDRSYAVSILSSPERAYRRVRTAQNAASIRLTPTQHAFCAPTA
jgi:hypothetical protein